MQSTSRRLIFKIRLQARSSIVRHQYFPRFLSSHHSNDRSAELKAEKKKLQLWEYPASHGSDNKMRETLFSESEKQNNTWSVISAPQLTKDTQSTSSINVQNRAYQIGQKALDYFLPAKYPDSVSHGYTQFAGFCFTASIAGSASMVLSTQTLLLAVGVVGSNAHQAGIMAGAFNWVMKDFVGQLGGVIFASQMGKTRAFDSDPKRWRMVAAMALDGATLLEILSPLFPAIFVLPVASVANVGKNIGFLTASASRAALHQSMAISGNLGDVTAKSGSQSIMASLIGTSLGIGMSSLLSHDTYNFALGFCLLGAIHQGCNYLSLRSVRLKHLNRQRLFLLIDHYIKRGEILDPNEVASKESFFPLVSSNVDTKGWLSIGTTSLNTMAASPSEFRRLMDISSYDKDGETVFPYIVMTTPDKHVNLTFFQSTTGEEIIRGMYHACLLQDSKATMSKMNESNIASMVDSNFADMITGIQDRGWNIETEVTSIESSHATRFRWAE